jgi:hypothetical protein
VKALRLEALSGAEDRRTKNSSDEERYYMREYTPGDRFRDINWKSSERIDTLITRISPDNQEKVTRIEVHFRNYGPSRPSIGEIWLLDRAKARLAWFLRNAKEEKNSFIFSVRAAGGNWEVKDQDEIDAFLEELAALPFVPAQNEDGMSAEGGGEIYVFSTACDSGLPAFLLMRQMQPLSLFLAQNLPVKAGAPSKGNLQKGGPPKGGTPSECEWLRLRDFPAGGFVPRPRWFFKRQKRQIGVRTGRMALDYAEVRL